MIHIYLFLHIIFGQARGFLSRYIATCVSILRQWVWEWDRERSKWWRKCGSLSSELLVKQRKLKQRKPRALHQPSSRKLSGHKYIAIISLLSPPVVTLLNWTVIISPWNWFLFFHLGPFSLFSCNIQSYLSKIQIILSVSWLKSSNPSKSLNCSQG